MSSFDVAVVVPVAVVELDEPHAALGQPAGQQAVRRERAVAALGAVQVERLLAARFDRSISSGTLVCIRNAISYWLMRVAISGSSTRSSCSWFELLRRRRPRRAARPASTPGGVADVEHRVALARGTATPWNWLGRKPLCHCRAAIGCVWPRPAGGGQHDEAGQVVGLGCRGRTSTHEPMLGRPEMVVPVFMNVWAGSWLIASVFIERMMQMSSATSADVREELGRSPGPTCRTS